jgi:hypothetical protein
MPNTAHILQITLPELWSLTYTMYIQFRIFWLQYSTERICAAIGDITTIQCALYCKLGAKYSAYPSDHAMWSVVRLQYSTERICAAIGDISTIQCALYCKLDAKFRAQPPFYAMCTLVPDMYNAITVPHMQASIFSWTYLSCYWRYIDNSMCVILQSWCQIRAHSPVFVMSTVVTNIYNVITVTYIQALLFRWTYMPCYWRYLDNSMRAILQIWSKI